MRHVIFRYNSCVPGGNLTAFGDLSTQPNRIKPIQCVTRSIAAERTVRKGAMRKRVRRLESVMREVGPKLLEGLLEVLVKVVGETIKDKVARAILIGLLSSVGHYAVSGGTPTPAPQDHISQPVEMNKAP